MASSVDWLAEFGSEEDPEEDEYQGYHLFLVHLYKPALCSSYLLEQIMVHGAEMTRLFCNLCLKVWPALLLSLLSLLTLEYVAGLPINPRSSFICLDVRK